MTTRLKSSLSRIAKEIKLLVFDFDGVFTDNRVLVLQDGTEGVFCNRSDGLGIGMVKKAGLIVMVISKERNPVVSARCRKLNIPCLQAIDDKSEALKSTAKKLGIPLRQVAYMGNDINDIECLEIVGLSSCVNDSHSKVLAVSLFKTQANGGCGAVRELCDFILMQKKIAKPLWK
jgi:YrbI family 3-deoxy-D-manno-octulosonate 8-phosphate phosphatase